VVGRGDDYDGPVSLPVAPHRKDPSNACRSGDGLHNHFDLWYPEAVQEVNRHVSLVIKRDATADEFTVGIARWISENRDTVRDSRADQIGGVQQRRTVATADDDDCIGDFSRLVEYERPAG
jgi:hypothetical protein